MKRTGKAPAKRAVAGLRFGEWCKNFQAHNSSRSPVVLCNIRYDCTKKRLGKEVLQAFRKAFLDAVRNESPDAVIRKVVESAPGSLLCQGTDQPRPAPCSRVMDGRDLLERNIRLSRLGLKIPVQNVATAVRDLEQVGLRGIAKKEMRGRLPFAWVTKTSEIDAIRQKVPPARLADELRDRLGLHQLREDQYLVEVVYPPGTPETLRAPTFLDGNDIVFRSARGRDSWGRTVDLRTLKTGLPEAVHPPVPFTEQFRVRDIGRLRRCTGLVFEKLADWSGCMACKKRRCACLIHTLLSP